MICFKVVQPYHSWDNKHGLKSARNTPFPVEYKVGEWVSPVLEGSKLFVFDTLERANLFACSSEKIFECEVENPEKLSIICCFMECFTVKTFWTRKDNINVMQMQAIPGTVGVDRIKLLREISDAERLGLTNA